MKQVWMFLLCGFLSACAGVVSHEPETAEEYYLQGYKAFQKTDYELAVKSFDAVEQNFPFSEMIILQMTEHASAITFMLLTFVKLII